MKSDHIFMTIIEGKMIGYGNLKILTETIGYYKKYHTIRRALASNGEVQMDEILIKRIRVIRGTKTKK